MMLNITIMPSMAQGLSPANYFSSLVINSNVNKTALHPGGVA
jgi:hypothetical protein